MYVRHLPIEGANREALSFDKMYPACRFTDVLANTLRGMKLLAEHLTKSGNCQRLTVLSFRPSNR